MRFRVRRLAALDLVGARGTALRRRVVLTEFLAAATAGVLVGGWLLTSGRVSGSVVGGWCLGVGANYAALAAHALHLLRANRLAGEVAAIPDPVAEARWYTVSQLLLVVPFLLVVLALAQLHRPGVAPPHAVSDGAHPAAAVDGTEIQ